MTTIKTMIHIKNISINIHPPCAEPACTSALADEGLLPTLRVKAANATHAEAMAHLASGKRVLRADRVEKTVNAVAG